MIDPRIGGPPEAIMIRHGYLSEFQTVVSLQASFYNSDPSIVTSPALVKIAAEVLDRQDEAKGMPIGLRALAIELGIPIHHEDKVDFFAPPCHMVGDDEGCNETSLGLRVDAETRRGFVRGMSSNLRHLRDGSMNSRYL